MQYSVSCYIFFICSCTYDDVTFGLIVVKWHGYVFPVDTEEEDDDDVMMEWFQLVTQKNELVRQETDLVYM